MATKAQSQMPVGTDELIARYRATCGLSEGASYGYAKVAERFCSFLDDNGLTLDDVYPDIVVAYANFVDKGQGKPSKRNLSTCIRHFFRWLEAEGLIDDAAGHVGAKGKHGKYSQRLRKSPKERADQRKSRDRPYSKPPGRPRDRNGSIDEELVDAFLRERIAAGKNSNQPAYAVRAFSRYIEDVGVPFEEVTSETLEAFGAWVRTAYAESSWSNIFTYVRVFYAWLEEKGYYENVARGFAVMGRRPPHRERIPLSVEDARKILEAAGDNDNVEIALRDRMIVGMMLVAALRPGEIQSADVGDVRFTGNSGAIVIRETSRKPASVVYLPPKVAKDARVYIEYRQARPEDPLVVSAAAFNAGERVHANTLSAALERAFSHAGLTGKPGAYSLRQTALELAMEEGYAGAQLRSLARVGSFASLQRLDYKRSLAAEPPQVKVAALLDDAEGDERHAVVTAGALRSMLADLGDEEAVALSIDRGRALRVSPIVVAGSADQDGSSHVSRTSS